MRVGLIAAAAAAALVVAAPSQAATGTYAGTVTNTQGKIALDVKINRAGFVTKIKEIRVKDVPSNCETSGPGVPVDHQLPTSLPVRDNGKFEGFFQQPVYNNV